MNGSGAIPMRGRRIQIPLRKLLKNPFQPAIHRHGLPNRKNPTRRNPPINHARSRRDRFSTDEEWKSHAQKDCTPSADCATMTGCALLLPSRRCSSSSCRFPPHKFAPPIWRSAPG